MKANEAHKLVTDYTAERFTIADLIWAQSQIYIFNQIREAAKSGKFTLKFNLKVPELQAIGGKHLDRLKSELEGLGYTVGFILERSPNGSREMIVSW